MKGAQAGEIMLHPPNDKQAQYSPTLCLYKKMDYHTTLCYPSNSAESLHKFDKVVWSYLESASGFTYGLVLVPWYLLHSLLYTAAHSCIRFLVHQGYIFLYDLWNFPVYVFGNINFSKNHNIFLNMWQKLWKLYQIPLSYTAVCSLSITVPVWSSCCHCNSRVKDGVVPPTVGTRASLFERSLLEPNSARLTLGQEGNLITQLILAQRSLRVFFRGGKGQFGLYVLCLCLYLPI